MTKHSAITSSVITLFTVVLCTCTPGRAAAASLAAAQDWSLGSSGSPTISGASPGWVVTPSILYSGSWDDNVLLHGNGDASQSDFLNVLNPRGDAEFNGKRTQFTGS